ncbi:hypothetical protein ACFVAJ_16340 [Agromyces sp. NPDC057679]|uniref:hypothetical protein n=1 Tax=Agromyces sp. NPDC057679 TaxID=3346207 RepID=UPI00366D5256
MTADAYVRDRVGKFAEHAHTPADADEILSWLNTPPAGGSVDPSDAQAQTISQLADHGLVYLRAATYGQVVATVLSEEGTLTEVRLFENGMVTEASALDEPGVEWRSAHDDDAVADLLYGDHLGFPSSIAIAPTAAQADLIGRLDGNGKAATSIRREDAGGTLSALTVLAHGTAAPLRSIISPDGDLLSAGRLTEGSEGELYWRNIGPRELKRISRDGPFPR